MPSNDKCCVGNCNNKRSDTVSLHYFPKNELIRRQWIARVSTTRLERSGANLVKEFTPTKYQVVCSEHFREEDFEKKEKVWSWPTLNISYHCKGRLKHVAVPSNFLCFKSNESLDSVSDEPKPKRSRKGCDYTKICHQQLDATPGQNDDQALSSQPMLLMTLEEAKILWKHLMDRAPVTFFFQFGVPFPPTRTSGRERPQPRQQLDNTTTYATNNLRAATAHWVVPVDTASCAAPATTDDSVPVEKTDTVDPADVTDRVAPVGTADTVDPADVTDRVAPVGTADTVHPADVVDSVASYHTADSVDPAVVVDKEALVDIADRVDSADRVDNVLCADVATCVGPAGTADSVRTTDNQPPADTVDGEIFSDWKERISSAEMSDQDFKFKVEWESEEKNGERENTDSDSDYKPDLGHFSDSWVSVNKPDEESQKRKGEKGKTSRPTKQQGDVGKVSVQKVDQHWKPVHVGEKLLCPYCGETFKYRVTLNAHIRRHTGDLFHCDQCDKAFSSKGVLEGHIRTVHGEATHGCSLCTKKFIGAKRLAKHVKIVHDKIKDYLCSECGKAFADRNGLYRHKFTHSGERRHKCDLCGATFNQKSNLTIHVRSHERNPGFLKKREWYNCPVCQVRCGNKKGLETHMTSHDI